MTAREHDLLIQLYEHKMALYKMIDQFGYTFKINNKEYFDDLCESAEEATFKALGIKEDRIFKPEFYAKWDNDESYLFELKGNKEHKPYHLETYEYLTKVPLWKSVL